MDLKKEFNVAAGLENKLRNFPSLLEERFFMHFDKAGKHNYNTPCIH